MTDRKSVLESLKRNYNSPEAINTFLLAEGHEELNAQELKELGLVFKKGEAEYKSEEVNDFLNFVYYEHGVKAGEVKSVSVNLDKIADYLINIYSFKTVYGKASEIVYVFNGKYYEPKGRELIKTSIEFLIKGYAKNHIVNEIFEKIKRKTASDKSEFENIDVNLINFNNGVFDINKKELLKHDSQYNFTFCIPHDYDKNKDCINFKEFCSGVLYQNDMKLIQEIFGFLLYRKYFLKKGFIFVGEKDTSKTTLLNIMIEFIGAKNKTSIPLQKISGSNDFTKLSLRDKHLNCYDDLSAQDLKDTAGFKIATGGGYISAEEKFGDYCQFMNFAKQIFATNKIPPINDNDDAYFGRWIILLFDNVVTNPDPFILQKILNKEEMSGIINWALEGLYRLLKKGNFSYEKSLEQTKLLMERSGNPLSAFVQDVLIRNEAGKITKEQMYEIYSIYADKNENPRLSKEQLGRQLPKKATYILDKRESERFWANVSLNPFYKDKDTLDAFTKILSNNEESKKQLNNITSKEASNSSKLDNYDTLDAFKEIKCCFCGNKEVVGSFEDKPVCFKHLDGDLTT